jgi:amidophosphoribosyltransferase
VEEDLDHTVFSYIPNTAESAFLGMMQGLESYLERKRLTALYDLTPEDLTARQGIAYERFMALMQRRPRVEKAAIKDAKLRTFISDDQSRQHMVKHVYDTTAQILEENRDALVVLDDSIVRGTTLRESIIAILSGLHPRMLVVVSSAPQIRYPDCYGIDMSRLGDFVAFQALVSILKRKGQEPLMEEHIEQARKMLDLEVHPMSNQLQALYALVTESEVSEEIARILTPEEVRFPIRVVFQQIPHLHQACPDHLGDWYFSGNYPTPGGHRVANRALVYFGDQIGARPY